MLDAAKLEKASPVRRRYRSDNDFFTAIFEREYVLTMTGQDEKTVLVKLASEDYTPIGYGKGGSELLHLDNVRLEKAKLSKYPTPDHLLAKLAFDHDKDLDHMTGCEHHNGSRKTIKALLGGFAHANPPVIEI